jgi:hypothetical protein
MRIPYGPKNGSIEFALLRHHRSAARDMTNAMPGVLDPFRFVLIAGAGIATDIFS